jgi:hypothetical protein
MVNKRDWGGSRVGVFAMVGDADVVEAAGEGELLTGEAVTGVIFPTPQADRK